MSCVHWEFFHHTLASQKWIRNQYASKPFKLTQFEYLHTTKHTVKTLAMYSMMLDVQKVLIRKLKYIYFERYIIFIYAIINTWSGTKAKHRYGTHSLQWRHNDYDGVPNHQPHGCFSTQPFIQTQIKENIKAPRHWPLWGEFTGTGEFPAQRASYAEKCFHMMTSSCSYNMI